MFNAIWLSFLKIPVNEFWLSFVKIQFQARNVEDSEWFKPYFAKERA